MNVQRLRAVLAEHRTLLSFALLAAILVSAAGCSNDIQQPEVTPAPFLLEDATPSASIAPEFCPNLPDYPVVVIHSQPGATTLFDIWFWGIDAGFDIASNETLPGWCVEDYPLSNVMDPGRVMLYCSYDDALPGNTGDLPWNEINYLLNHRYGTWQEIQAAIWLVIGLHEPSIAPTENSHAMANDALANGAGFVPGPGDLIAILLYTGDGGIAPDGVYQETIIELRLPGDDDGGEACTPGYWKTHFADWPMAYDPMDDFDTVFGTDYFDGMTLGDATWARGGDLYRLARHGTAALLNAASGGVDYPYTVEEVIAMVQSGDADTLADTNDELDCPLEGTSADPTQRAQY